MQIVVVAESVYLRTSLRVNLDPAGYRVMEAEPSSILEVLEVLRATLPGLAVVDLDLMPRCSGETLIRVIREDPVLRDTPLMVMVSHEHEAILRRLRPWGALSCMKKPFHADELVAMVNHRFAKAV